MLDLTSDPNRRQQAETSAEKAPPKKTAKKFIGVNFNCCNMYVHIYVNKDGTAYEGRCPKCGKPIKLKIGEGGTSNRFFEAY
jgi:hypothetical protein